MDDLDTQASGDAAVRYAASEPGGKLSFAITDGGGADPTHQHLFHLAGAAPSRFDGGDLRGSPRAGCASRIGIRRRGR